METITIVYIIGTIGMLVGIPPALSLRGRDTEFNYDYLIGIPGLAGLMYLLMTLGIGMVPFQGYEVPILRYVDWILTTPLLVGYTVYIAGFEKRGIIGVAVVDALMIAIGVVAIVLPPPGQWVAFGGAALCYLALLLILYGPARRSAWNQPNARRRLARLLLNYVGLVWLTYPVVWVFGPGLHLVAPTGVAIMIVYMDVISKVPFVYFIHRAQESLGSGIPTGDTNSSTSDAPATSTV